MNWIKNVKHPETPAWIFKNVWSRDRIRSLLKSRCAICDTVITADADAVKEIAVKCGSLLCRCRHYLTLQAHKVCEVCYDMHKALYGNVGLKNMNYFKEIDESEAKRKGDDRNRMGLQ